MNWSRVIFLFKLCKSRVLSWRSFFGFFSLFLLFFLTVCFINHWWLNQDLSFKLFRIQSFWENSIFPNTFFQLFVSLTIKSPKTILFAINPKPIVIILIWENKFSFPFLTTINILSLILRTIFPNKPTSTMHKPIFPIPLIRVLFIIIQKEHFSFAMRD